MGITLDYTCLLSGGPQGGAGVAAGDLAAIAAQHGQRLAAIQARRAAGELGFLDLPDAREVAEACCRFADAQEGRFANLVVLGIGGSALGALALHAALSPALHNLKSGSAARPRLFVVDNIDPVLVTGVLRTADAARSLFIVISKSGNTAETMAQFLLFLEALKSARGDRWREHVVVVTDKTKGALRPFAEANGLATFSIPENVGGRFSVLSPVGLLPGALMGWDIERLLAGAAAGRQMCLRDDFSSNPAAILAATHYLLDLKSGLNVQVLFPYCHRLRMLPDWHIQLMAESLGKHSASGRGVGPTPHKALGATDQHSQVQLFMQGPQDKVFTFLRVLEHEGDVVIPDPPPGLDGLEYLAGRTFAQLLDAECRATHLALVQAGRPCCMITFPVVTAETVGQWMMWMMMAVAYAGMLYEVDAFDQPGVEAGKTATYGLMGRKGFEQERRRVESTPLSDGRYVIG